MISVYLFVEWVNNVHDCTPNPSYRILLYYKYVSIDEPEQFAEAHLTFCKQLGVKGRILVATEGINGTLSGTVAQTQAYMNAMHADPRFADMTFKIDEADQHAFKRLSVRPKREIVRLELDEDIDPNQLSGERLSPKAFYEMLQRDDVVVIDGRNDYEYDIGHFRNAIRPNIQTFREFPEWIKRHLTDYKDKKVLTYCTGGIRCEKLSGYLLQEGFEDVAQLDGGIISYSQDPDVQGRLYDGKCYVFDERIAVAVNHTDEDVIVGRCHHCGKPEDRYINCAYQPCHLQHVSCPDCREAYHDCCSEACMEAEANRVAQKSS